ncbi:retroviral-like aspartic protease, partial [Solirubrobacter sp. CPCC 204708]|nr:retroviral-like aspartic protease [Solirubrobacter deserti]
LLEAIKRVPAYAKFLKDLCTQKRKTKVPKDAFMTEMASSILKANTPPKLKDPGCPTIPIVMGEHRIDHALIDFGASVNLIPYHVYQQLELGDLEPTMITLQLADRSVKRPKGIVRDVIVQVNSFYFPVDFIVLETQPVPDSGTQIPVILGRPFLATSNAIIYCKNGIMTISFGNMTVNLNIFNVCRQMEEYDDEEEVHQVN